MSCIRAQGKCQCAPLSVAKGKQPVWISGSRYHCASAKLPKHVSVDPEGMRPLRSGTQDSRGLVCPELPAPKRFSILGVRSPAGLRGTVIHTVRVGFLVSCLPSPTRYLTPEHLRAWPPPELSPPELSPLGFVLLPFPWILLLLSDYPSMVTFLSWPVCCFQGSATGLLCGLQKEKHVQTQTGVAGSRGSTGDDGPVPTAVGTAHASRPPCDPAPCPAAVLNVGQVRTPGPRFPPVSHLLGNH